MRVLAFSDLHRDLDQAARLVELCGDADVVIGAGDFASIHEGLEETIDALAAIEAPTVLVPGNNETEDALREAAADWAAATVLHGELAEIDGVAFFGLGAGVPITPWDWSFDLSDDEAAERLAACPEGAVLVRPLAAATGTSTPRARATTSAAPRSARRSRPSGRGSPSAATSTRAGAAESTLGPTADRQPRARPAPGSSV